MRRGGFAGAALARGAVLGKTVWDRQHGFRIRIGPTDHSAYLRFIPGGDGLPALVAFARQYLNRELDWNLPEDDATTIAGLVIAHAGAIPDTGQRFAFFGHTFEVMRRQRNQIKALRIVPPGITAKSLPPPRATA